MIQEIFPNSFNNHFQENLDWGENDYILSYGDRSLLLKTTGDELELPRKKDFSELSDTTEHIFLFTLNQVPCFLVWEVLKVESDSFTYKEINFFRTTDQHEIAWISIVGMHLQNWYAQNRFCGKCGELMHHKQDERAMICPVCNHVVYPKISPAIIVAITRNDKILLARNSAFPGRWFSLISGYVDVGETLEETLIREVKEEVGLEVSRIRYYKSQPWPVSGSLMVGFVAEADDTQEVCIDGREIVEAGWFTRGNLPSHSSTISIAGEMIEKFEKGEL